MELTVAEKNTAVWHKIDRFLTVKIEETRKQNDKPLDHDQTTFLRGRLSAFKWLQSQGDDIPSMESDPLPE